MEYLECRDNKVIRLPYDFQKYMIDKNDPQLDEHGRLVPLLTNKTFKHQIEKDCEPLDGNSSLKDAK